MSILNEVIELEIGGHYVLAERDHLALNVTFVGLISGQLYAERHLFVFVERPKLKLAEVLVRRKGGKFQRYGRLEGDGYVSLYAFSKKDPDPDPDPDDPEEPPQ